MKYLIRLLMAALLLLPLAVALQASDINYDQSGFDYQQAANAVELPWTLLSQSQADMDSPLFEHWNGSGEKVREAACCKRCSKGKPCGNSCISRTKSCRVGPGCAC